MQESFISSLRFRKTGISLFDFQPGTLASSPLWRPGGTLASPVSSRRSSQGARAHLYVAQIRSCETYIRGRCQQIAESEASEPGWFPTSKELHLHKAQDALQCTG